LFIDSNRRKSDGSRFELFDSFTAQAQNPHIKIEGAMDVAHVENDMIEIPDFDRHGSPPAPFGAITWPSALV
jgi:hypothetical protein